VQRKQTLLIFVASLQISEASKNPFSDPKEVGGVLKLRGGILWRNAIGTMGLFESMRV
jgi:hypothetical protein